MTIDERLNELTAVHAETAASINQLTLIAESHEHRTDRFDEVLRAGAEESRAADRRLGINQMNSASASRPSSQGSANSFARCGRRTLATASVNRVKTHSEPQFFFAGVVG